MTTNDEARRQKLERRRVRTTTGEPTMTPDETRLLELERKLEALLRRVQELEQQLARERQAQLQLDRGT